MTSPPPSYPPNKMRPSARLALDCGASAPSWAKSHFLKPHGFGDRTNYPSRRHYTVVKYTGWTLDHYKIDLVFKGSQTRFSGKVERLIRFVMMRPGRNSTNQHICLTLILITHWV